MPLIFLINRLTSFALPLCETRRVFTVYAMRLTEHFMKQCNRVERKLLRRFPSAPNDIQSRESFRQSSYDESMSSNCLVRLKNN